MPKKTMNNAKKDSNKDLPDISLLVDQLTMISRALGAVAVRLAPSRPKKLQDQVHFLSRLGFDRHAVAAILGSTPGSMSVRMSEGRKPKRVKGKRRGKN